MTETRGPACLGTSLAQEEGVASHLGWRGEETMHVKFRSVSLAAAFTIEGIAHSPIGTDTLNLLTVTAGQ